LRRSEFGVAHKTTLLSEKRVHPDLIELELTRSERNTVRAAYSRVQRLSERR
jgi:hypothetical protein